MGFDYTKNLIRRSRLIMPANERKYVEKAHLRNADAVVLDLEDSVPVSEKVATRAVLKEHIPQVGRCGSVYLRHPFIQHPAAFGVRGRVFRVVQGVVVPGYIYKRYVQR